MVMIFFKLVNQNLFESSTFRIIICPPFNKASFQTGNTGTLLVKTVKAYEAQTILLLIGLKEEPWSQ